MPFRDLFAVLFFVSVGMLLDPAALVADAGGGRAPRRRRRGRQGRGHRRPRPRALGMPVRIARSCSAAAIAQVGEFSFLLAESALPARTSSMPARTTSILGTAVLSIVVGPITIPVGERLAVWSELRRDRQPQRTRTGTAPAAGRRAARDPRAPRSRRVRSRWPRADAASAPDRGRRRRGAGSSSWARGASGGSSCAPCAGAGSAASSSTAISGRSRRSWSLGAETLFGDAANPEILAAAGSTGRRVLVDRDRRPAHRAARHRARPPISTPADDRRPGTRPPRDRRRCWRLGVAPRRRPGGGGRVRARVGTRSSGWASRARSSTRSSSGFAATHTARITAGQSIGDVGDVGLSRRPSRSARSRPPSLPAPEVVAMTTEPSTRSSDADEVTTARMVIGGEPVDAAEGQTFDVVNPATGRVIATAPLGGKHDVDRAVDAARRAFDDPQGLGDWPATKRGRSLAKLAELISDHTEGARGARDAQRRQADQRRDAARSSAQPRVRLLRGRREQALRRDDPGLEARPRPHAARADRRRRRSSSRGTSRC